MGLDGNRDDWTGATGPGRPGEWGGSGRPWGLGEVRRRGPCEAGGFV